MSEIDGGSSFRAAGGGSRIPPRVKSVEEKLKDASKMYEKMFMREMMKAMRSSVSESGFIKKNQAEQIFQDELDQETVNNWSEHQGVGIADMIYNNMIDRYGAQLGIRAPVSKPKGPLPLDEKSNYAGVARVPAPSVNQMTYRFDRRVMDSSQDAKDAGRSAGSSSGQSLVAPWDGVLTGKRELGEGVHLLEIAHDHGPSKLTFRGTPDRLVLGQSVQAGERIGLLSPEAKSFFLTVGVEGEKATPPNGVEAASGAEKALESVSE